MASSVFSKAKSTVLDLLKTNNSKADEDDYDYDDDEEYEEYVEEDTPRKKAEKQQKTETKQAVEKEKFNDGYNKNSYSNDAYKPDFSQLYTPKANVPKQEFKTSYPGKTDYYDNTKKTTGYQYSSQERNSNVFNMKSAPAIKHKFMFSMVKFEKIEDTVAVADQMLSGNTVTLINLHDIPENVARRVIDFLDGVRYTCNARIEQVADLTYIILPETIELTGDFTSQVDTNGLTFFK